jgi:hypothetical protein
VWTGFVISSGKGQVVESCEHDNEPSGSVKGGEFLDQLRDRYLFKNDTIVWSLFLEEIMSSVVCKLE